MEIVNFSDKIRTLGLPVYPIDTMTHQNLARFCLFDINKLQAKSCFLRIDPVTAIAGKEYAVKLSFYPSPSAFDPNSATSLDRTHTPPSTLLLKVVPGYNLWRYSFTSVDVLSGKTAKVRVTKSCKDRIKLTNLDLSTPDKFRNWISAYFAKYYYLFYVTSVGNPTIITIH